MIALLLSYVPDGGKKQQCLLYNLFRDMAELLFFQKET